MVSRGTVVRGALVAAVEQALRAPSVHNTQPWRWRIGPDSVALHADRGRSLPATDPDGRDLLLSCGAALHHLRVALAAQGLGARTAYGPDPEDADHLATVTAAGPPDADDRALAPAIARRRTDRRRMGADPVPAAHLTRLAAHARRHGAELVAVARPAARARLAAALAEADSRQRWVPGYAAELQQWTRRTGDRDGMGAGNLPAPGAAGLANRSFPPHGRLAAPAWAPGDGDDAATLLVLLTAADGVVDRLRAGEAASAVLLAATGQRLATTPLSQAVEVDATRAAVRDAAVSAGHPQLVLRVGWPAGTAAELPTTPRRDLRAVLLPSR